MAENTHAASRSQLSQSSGDDNSSGHSPGSFATLSGGSSGGGGGLSSYPVSLSNNRPPPVPPSSAVFCIIPREPMPDQGQLGLITPSSKRPRGRPPGSKNKPKPPVVIKHESEEGLKPVIFEISAGNDVVETLLSFARSRRVGITVLSGSGSVSDVTLRHPVSRAPVFPIHGPFHLLSLTGTYIGGRYPSLLSSNPPTLPPCSSFGICLAGSQGQVFGGVVGGKVTAATLVVVVATIFKKPEFHRVPFIIDNAADEGDEVDDDDDGGIYATVLNAADRSGAVQFNGNINNSVIAMIPNMPPGFGVAANPAQMNGQVPVADMNNVMQWNHPNNLP